MGYYTNYSLRVDKKQNEIMEYLEEESDFDSSYVIEALEDYGESRKWYEHDDDMKKISIQFPDVIFTLSGEGEESGDLWVKYYLNGRKQYCPATITYDDFDESKLETIK